MKKLSSIVLTSLAPVTLLATASLTTSCTPTDEKLIHDPNVYYHPPKLADDITVIDLNNFDNDLKADINTTFQSLQGILAQEEAKLFVLSGNYNRDKWLFDMQKKYHFGINVIDKVDHDEQAGVINDIWDVLALYKNKFHSQYIQYVKADASAEEGSAARENISINNATMVSACDHYLMVSDKLIERYATQFANIGISKASDEVFDPTDTAIEVFNEYKERLNKRWILCQDPVEFSLRDYAIAARMPTVCIGLLDPDSREIVGSAMEPNSPIFGWSHGYDGKISGCGAEQDHVIWSTTHKLNVLASNHCYNLSLLSYDKTDKPYKQYNQKHLVANPNKHYLAIVMSDGDNIQWMQNDFLRSSEYWGSPYRGDFPISWTISPTPIDLNNGVLEELYATATPNDEIIAGPSGYAYINPAWYYQESLMDDYQAFAKRTAEYMHDCDLSVINTLDYDNPNHESPTNPECMLPLMQQDQIKGLVWSLDGLSLDGHGSISWVNDKPLLSFREGMWDNPELRQADILNRLCNVYPRDIHKIDGYTALVVNVWGPEGKMDKLADFVTKLPEDVELVTISQLLQLISDNVPHINATPVDYPIR